MAGLQLLGVHGMFCSGVRASSTTVLEMFEIPEEPRSQYELLPPFQQAKLTLETFNLGFSAFICLMKVGYNSTVAANSSRKFGLAIACVLQMSTSVILIFFNKWRTLKNSSFLD
jgi:hypothetical protein